MWSLKSFTDPLARILGTTPAALYERQRALVRAGLLNQAQGRGPGSGARATPETVATLIISAIATTSLSEVEERTRAIAEAKVIRKSKRARPPVESTTFASLLAWALESPANAKTIAVIRVSHTEPEAQVFFHKSAWLFFGHKTPPPPGTEPRRLLKIQADLQGDGVKQIADDLHATREEADAG